MECKDAIGKINPFLHGELSPEDTEALLKHIDNCASCKEELEIYYTVMATIDNLDGGYSSSFNMSAQYEEMISHTKRQLRLLAWFKRIRRAALAISSVAVIVVLLMEIAIYL